MLDFDTLPDGVDPEMVARAATEWRAQRERSGGIANWVRSRSSVFTDADLNQHLRYLEGFPEAQRDARESFIARQAERDREMARRANRAGKGKAAARAFMADRRAFLKTLGKSQAGRWHDRRKR